ncbi:MAG: dTDP-4-dehydrorhamnose 3,5-epimerase [Acidobacteriota bacterium]
MKVIETELPGVLVIEPKVVGDDRGFFMETYHAAKLAEATGIEFPFVQDNHSFSRGPVVRGLHYQEPKAQGKLVRVISGSVFDVAVDIRRGSPHFGKWVSCELSAGNRRQLWIPPGFAHGFCLLTPEAEMVYKCTEPYDGESDRGIIWNDPEIGVAWPLTEPILSAKDAALPRLRDAAVLPVYQ